MNNSKKQTGRQKRWRKALREALNFFHSLHATQAANRRKWKPLYCWTVMTYSGKIPITGMRILMKAVPKGHKRKKGWRCYSLHQNWGDYEELSLKSGPEQVKRLWVSIRDQDSKGIIMDGIPTVILIKRRLLMRAPGSSSKTPPHLLEK